MVTMEQIRAAVMAANEQLPQVFAYLDQPLQLRDYSGRGMYGRVCPAVSGPSPVAVCAALAAGCATGEEAAELIAGLKTDSMGMGVVLYWPGVEWDEKGWLPQEQEEGREDEREEEEA